jgi:hypothetical protein
MKEIVRKADTAKSISVKWFLRGIFDEAHYMLGYLMA